ncbi:META domain-containing protein [Chitinibacteraceae bacterium HSL-7]
MYRASAALLLASLTSAAYAQELSGVVAYPAEFATPRGSTLTLELRDITRAEPMLKRWTLPATQGKAQAFSLTFDDALMAASGRYQLSVALTPSSGNVALAAAAMPLFPRDDKPLAVGALPLAAPARVTDYLQCGSERIELVAGHAVTWLKRGETQYALHPLMGSSGARYLAIGSNVQFWAKGPDSWITIEGKQLPHCRMLPRENATPSIDARGNEPGWRLTSQDGETVRLNRPGQAAMTGSILSLPGSSVHRLTFGQLQGELALSQTLCRDSMTGMPYPQTAKLTLPDTTLHGCAGDTRSLLVGGEWHVNTLNGKALSGDRLPTLIFSAEGGIGGFGSCNRYSGSFTLGEGLSIGKLASTMMACSPERMSREHDLLEALPKTQRMDFDADGQLTLWKNDQVFLRAKRQ